VDQADLLRHAIDVLETQQINYMVVGSFASAVYGEPRLTHFPAPEFYVSVEAARKAAAGGGQFNVVHPASGNKIDFLSPRPDAWGQRQLTRRIRKPILPDREAFTASPEDVILGKLWYYHEGGSEKHLRDVAAMLQVSGDQIDRTYVDRWAAELGLTEPWQAVAERLE